MLVALAIAFTVFVIIIYFRSKIEYAEPIRSITKSYGSNYRIVELIHSSNQYAIDFVDLMDDKKWGRLFIHCSSLRVSKNDKVTLVRNTWDEGTREVTDFNIKSVLEAFCKNGE